MLYEVITRIRARRRASRGPSLLSRVDIPFPNTLDRYVLREFLKVLAAIIISVVVLQLVVDYSETAGDIAENHPSLHTVVITSYSIHYTKLYETVALKFPEGLVTRTV